MALKQYVKLVFSFVVLRRVKTPKAQAKPLAISGIDNRLVRSVLVSFLIL